MEKFKPNADAQALQGPHGPQLGEPALPVIPLRLILTPGGQTVEVDRPAFLIGRHSEADLRLPLADVSRRHCRCVFTEQGWEIHDLGSSNGVFINGRRVRTAPLRQHDRLTIGSFTFEVHLGPPGSAGMAVAPNTPLQSIVQALTASPEPTRKAG